MEHVMTPLRLTERKLVKYGKMLSVIAIIVVTVQFFAHLFLGAPSLPYLYAAALSIPAIMSCYIAGKLYYYLSWKSKHNKIADLLGLQHEHYYERAFAQKAQKNFFEKMLLQYHQMDLADSSNDSERILWNEAKQLAKQAEQRQISTSCVADVAERAELYREDLKLVREKLLAGEFDAAYQAIDEGAWRKAKVEDEVKEIIQKAEAVRCLPVLNQEFENRDFDPRKARELIASARLARRRGGRCGVEDDVIAALEAGNLDEARSVVNKQEEAKRKMQQKAEELDSLNECIDALKVSKLTKNALRNNLNKLRDKTYGTRDYRKAFYNLKNDIEEKEI